MKHSRVLFFSAVASALVCSFNVSAQSIEDGKELESVQDIQMLEQLPDNRDKKSGLYLRFIDSDESSITNSCPDKNCSVHRNSVRTSTNPIKVIETLNFILKQKIEAEQKFLNNLLPSAALLDNGQRWLEQYARDRRLAQERINEYEAQIKANLDIIEKFAPTDVKDGKKTLTEEELGERMQDLINLWGPGVESIQIVFKDGETQTFQNEGFNKEGKVVFSQEVENAPAENENEAVSEDFRKYY